MKCMKIQFLKDTIVLVFENFVFFSLTTPTSQNLVLHQDLTKIILRFTSWTTLISNTFFFKSLDFSSRFLKIQVHVAWKVTLYSCTPSPLFPLYFLFLISLTNQKLETRNKNHSTMPLKTILSIGKWGILFKCK